MIFEKTTRENGKHYLYIHTRLDKNVVFYVGIGTKYKHNNDYTRAKCSRSQRNKLWCNITSRTDYKIGIINESDSYDFIKELEILTIAKYGRIIKNNGTLCNITDGGTGVLGYRNMNLIKPIYLYHKSGEFYKEFEAYSDCEKFLNVESIHLHINKQFLCKGFIIKSYKCKLVEPIKDIKEKLKDRLSLPIYQYDINMNFIKEWVSSSEASRILKISGGHIRECAIGKQTANKGRNTRKTAGGFKWSYIKY